MEELEYWVDFRNRLQSKVEVILSRPYKAEGYYKTGAILDSDYAGKAWNLLRDCNLFAELPERRLN